MSLEYEAIKKSFNSAAQNYEKNAVLQREVLLRLLERLDDEVQINSELAPSHIVDLGCGTGWAISEIITRFNQVNITAIDFSIEMLKNIQETNQVQFLLNDVHDLPLEDSSVDIVFSNMLIHWTNETDVFKECMRILKPGGLLLMSALGETSLVELKHAWLSVDKQAHVHNFSALHQMGDDLLKKGFEQVVVNAEVMTLTYADTIALMKDIKASGGHNVDQGRKKGLMARSQLSNLQQGYEQFIEEGRYPASYEIVYLRAKKPSK